MIEREAHARFKKVQVVYESHGRHCTRETGLDVTSKKC